MSAIERGLQQIIDKTAFLYQNGPKRQITLDIRNLLRRPDITTDAEVDISAIAGKTLAYLRSAHQEVSSEYGRKDIVEGLGAIDHPAAQTVVIESLLDPSPLVAKTAERTLLDPNRYIYQETLDKLLDHDDAEVKDLGLRIIEHNPKGGVMPDGNVVPGVIQVLDAMITPGTEKKEVEASRKGAILASLLHERTNGAISANLYEHAEGFLTRDINNRIRILSEKNTFANLIDSMLAVNETAAKTAVNIQALILTLPPQLENEPEELKALVRLWPTEFERPHEIVEKYKSLVALIKERVRENLPNHVAQIKSQEEKRRQQLQAQIDETNRLKQLQLQRDQERQAQVRREQRTAELELVRRARQWFPHL